MAFASSNPVGPLIPTLGQPALPKIGQLLVGPSGINTIQIVTIPGPLDNPGPGPTAPGAVRPCATRWSSRSTCPLGDRGDVVVVVEVVLEELDDPGVVDVVVELRERPFDQRLLGLVDIGRVAGEILLASAALAWREEAVRLGEQRARSSRPSAAP